ncbi:MAG TPA: class F sortase [Candidatus Dormibacteraeota bacterium]
MAKIWSLLGRRRRMSMPRVGEVMLTVMLGVALGFASSDATPNDDQFAAVAPAPAGMVSENNLQPAELEHSKEPPPAPPPEAAIPTAPPVQLLIPALDVHRAVEAVGVDRFGLMSLPVNAWNAGWYKGGPVPGAPGDAVIEGHAGYPGQPMIFGKLVTLRPGDKIIVVLSDRSRHLFLVVSMRSVPAGSAPAGFAEPYGPPRLTLVTCTGHFDKKSYWYSERLVVEATYAGLV